MSSPNADSKSVDAIIRDPVTGRVELLLLETSPPIDPSERQQLLQERLHTYVSYIDSGQYREQVPQSRAEELAIRVLWSRPLTADLSAIEAVRAHGDGQAMTVVPVVFEAESEFRVRLAGANAGPARPWWKFW